VKKTELDSYLQSIKIVKPSFKLTNGKRVVFAEIITKGITIDGANNYEVILLDGVVKQISRELGSYSVTVYMIELSDGTIKRVNRNNVIEVVK
jgi:hypothetical protein